MDNNDFNKFWNNTILANDTILANAKRYFDDDIFVEDILKGANTMRLVYKTYNNYNDMNPKQSYFFEQEKVRGRADNLVEDRHWMAACMMLAIARNIKFNIEHTNSGVLIQEHHLLLFGGILGFYGGLEILKENRTKKLLSIYFSNKKENTGRTEQQLANTVNLVQFSFPDFSPELNENKEYVDYVARLLSFKGKHSIFEKKIDRSTSDLLGFSNMFALIERYNYPTKTTN